MYVSEDLNCHVRNRGNRRQLELAEIQTQSVLRKIKLRIFPYLSALGFSQAVLNQLHHVSICPDGEPGLYTES